MDNKLMAKGMLKAWEDMGVQIQKWTKDNIVYITVPKVAKTYPNEPYTTGEQLAERLQKTMDCIFGKRTITFKYKILD